MRLFRCSAAPVWVQALAVGLSLVSAPARADAPPPIPDGMGRLVILRPWRYVGGASPMQVALNGAVVGLSHNGEYFYVDRPPGLYAIQEYATLLSLIAGGGPQPVSLHAGQTVYVSVLVGGSAPTVQLVTADEGAKAMASEGVSKPMAPEEAIRPAALAARARADFEKYRQLSGLDFQIAQGRASSPETMQAPAPTSSSVTAAAATPEATRRMLARNLAPAPDGVYAAEDDYAFNVLDDVTFDPATKTLALYGHRDPSFRGPRIPYLQYLATLLETPKPEFTLTLTPDSSRRVDALFNQAMSPEEGAQISEGWGRVVDERGQVTAVGRAMLPSMGVNPIANGARPGFLGAQVESSGDAFVRVTTVKPGSPAEAAGLMPGCVIVQGGAEGMPFFPEELVKRVRFAGEGASFPLAFTCDGQSHQANVTLTAAPDADPWSGVDGLTLGSAVYAAAGDQAAARVVHALGLMSVASDRYPTDQTLSQAVLANYVFSLGAADEFNRLREQAGAAGGPTPQIYSQIGDLFASHMESIFHMPAGQLSGAFESRFSATGNFGEGLNAMFAAFKQQLATQLEPVIDHLIFRPEGLQIPPELVESQFHVHPEMTPDYLGAASNSQLARLMFSADYTAKQIVNAPALKATMPDYQTSFEFERTHPQFNRTEAAYRLWISVDKMDTPQSADGNTLNFRETRMRFNVREQSADGEDLPNAPDGYEALLTRLYEPLAHKYSDLHELEEAAKLAAAARWIHARSPEFALPKAGRVPWAGPSRAPGLVYIYMYPDEARKTHVRFIAMGGVSLTPFPQAGGTNPFASDSSVVDLTQSGDVAPVLAYGADPIGAPVGQPVPITGYDNTALRRILREQICVPSPITGVRIPTADKGVRDYQMLTLALKDLDKSPDQLARDQTLRERLVRAQDLARQLATTERAMNILSGDNATAAAQLNNLQGELRQQKAEFTKSVVETLDGVGDDMRSQLGLLKDYGRDSSGSPIEVSEDARGFLENLGTGKILADTHEFLGRLSGPQGWSLNNDALEKMPDGLAGELLKGAALDAGYAPLERKDIGEVVGWSPKADAGAQVSRWAQETGASPAAAFNAMEFFEKTGEVKLLARVAQQEWTLGKLEFFTDPEIAEADEKGAAARETLKEHLAPLQRELSDRLDTILHDPDVHATLAAHADAPSSGHGCGDRTIRPR